MFAGLKNKIKEETGNDVSLIPAIVNSNQPKLLGKGRHSRQGSTTSLGSFTIDGTKEDGAQNMDIKLADGKIVTPKEFKKLEAKEEEWRKKLQKKEEEFTAKLKKAEEGWKKQLEEKEKEMKKELDKKNNEKKALEDERDELIAKNIKLEESAKKAADYQKKVCQYQEDIDQLEGFQTQEMAKIKHLLLVKEQEVAEKERLIKENNIQMESLKLEVVRLRKFEQEYENIKDDLESVRHDYDLEKSQLSSELAQREEEVRHLKDRVVVLEQRSNAGCVALGAELTLDERVQALLGERALLERRLEEAHLHLSDIKSSWSSKITSLETQVGRLCRQASEESAERRQAELDRDLANAKITELEEELEKVKAKLELKNTKAKRLQVERDEFEEELKNLKVKLEEDVLFLRGEIESANQNALSLEKLLKEKEDELKENQLKSSELESSLNKEKNNSSLLQLEIIRLKDAYETEKKFSSEINDALEKEKREKDDMMMRNAQISQEVELARQELREQGLETTELQSRVSDLEYKIIEREKDLDLANIDKVELSNRIKDLEKLESEKEHASSVEKELRAKITQLENDLFDKNKNIKVLQQRLTDMKKTLQRELKVPVTAIDPGGTDSDGFIPSYASSTSSGSNMAVLTPSSTQQLHVTPRYRTEEVDDEVNDDVNFKYLKHVLIKFLTSREYEAQHLTRAVATLLRFSAEEERLLKETLEWKMSWFGTRPNLGNGQTAKTIPPS